jgi:hydrogenase-4 component F
VIALGLLLVPPVLGAILALAVGPHRFRVGAVNAGLSLLSLGGALALWRELLAADAVTAGPSDVLRADALSALLATCVAGVSALALWSGPGLRRLDEARRARRFQLFTQLFSLTMLLAVTTNNVGVMWVAIEASTIVSAMLIPLDVSRASVEASWKYILLGSVGVALAFAGTVLGYFDFIGVVGGGMAGDGVSGRHAAALNWTVLRAAAPSLHPEVLELAFVFVLVGYGTKAGLAPMHTWLPDAHSEAPAPVSAMMSGVLLAVALYAVLRWKAVVSVTAGSAFPNRLVVLLGVASLVIGSLSLVVQRNYKRLLAYSSVEHMGLMCVGLTLGPLGVFATMLHLLNHALAKSTTFILAGRILHRYGTTDLRRISGLLRAMPWTGGLFLAGGLALIGLPPFGLFLSELALVRAGFAAGRPWLTALVLALLVVASFAVLGHLNRMLYGRPPASAIRGEERPWQLVPLGLGVVALAVLGVTLPPPVVRLLDRIVTIVGP